MKKLLLSISLIASAVLPSAAHAQAIPAAIVAVVDLEKVQSQCTACQAAQAALRSQLTALQNRSSSLAAPLQTEGKSIQAAVDALNGKEPDAALKARITAFETKQQQGQQELQRQQQQIQRNTAYISQQIQTKLGPIYQQVMQRRGANVMIEQGATLASGATLDVTNDVLTALNAQLPSVQTTAPAATQQQTQGR
ncbi:OmpH family outer membrane protein [Sphingomonas agri]|uniref:OmpH family outer membrane protein n=1 Tax=Sphingomonas agri TaxID=1813878 RepID=UPI00311E52A0